MKNAIQVWKPPVAQGMYIPPLSALLAIWSLPFVVVALCVLETLK